MAAAGDMPEFDGYGCGVMDAAYGPRGVAKAQRQTELSRIGASVEVARTQQLGKC